MSRTESETIEAPNMFGDAIRLPSVTFPHIGATVTGRVIAREFATIPKFDDRGRIIPDEVVKNDDGTDKLQVDVTLETEDGRKTLHTDGAVFYAIGRALAEIGSDDLVVGDTLTVEYTGDGEPTAKGRNAPKQYRATVVKAV